MQQKWFLGEWLYSQNIAPCETDSKNDSLFYDLLQFNAIHCFFYYNLNPHTTFMFSPKLIYRIMHLLLFCQNYSNELFLELISNDNKDICNS